jgi:hypothetical protein
MKELFIEIVKIIIEMITIVLLSFLSIVKK